jgi:hypothetical protein
LDRLDVEVAVGQVTLVGTFEHDWEGCLHVGVGEEQVVDHIDLAIVPIEFDVMQHQRGIAGIRLCTEAVVRQRPERAVRHGLDAGETLDRLTVERERKAGGPIAVHAGDSAEPLRALSVRGREFAGGFQEFRCVSRRRVIVFAERIAWAVSFAGNAFSSADAEAAINMRSAV